MTDEEQPAKLGVATVRWRDFDAREAICGLNDDLSRVPQGFAVSKDLVLKAGLFLTEMSDIRFEVASFSTANTRTLDKKWDDVAAALRLGARLPADSGFSERRWSPSRLDSRAHDHGMPPSPHAARRPRVALGHVNLRSLRTVTGPPLAFPNDCRPGRG